MEKTANYKYGKTKENLNFGRPVDSPSMFSHIPFAIIFQKLNISSAYFFPSVLK